MESFQSLRMLRKNIFMCKLDLSDAHLSVPLSDENWKRKDFKVGASVFWSGIPQTQTKKVVMADRDTVVFFTSVTGFCEKSKEILVIPAQEIEFVRMIIISKEMTIPLIPEKLRTIKLMCVNLLQNPQTTISE